MTQTLAAIKKSEIRKWFRNTLSRKAILFEDETDLLLYPPLRSTWMLRGTTKPVNLSGQNAKRIVWGTINVETGHRLFMESMRQRSLDFQEFLKLIRAHYRRWEVALLLDGDRSHTAQASEKMANHLGIEMVRLPLRSPKLNAVDHLWRDAKELVCVNRQYVSIDDQVMQFVSLLYGLTATEALKKAGLLSGDFWLYK